MLHEKTLGHSLKDILSKHMPYMSTYVMFLTRYVYVSYIDTLVRMFELGYPNYNPAKEDPNLFYACTL